MPGPAEVPCTLGGMTSCALSRALAGPLLVGYALAVLTGSAALAWAGGLAVATVTLVVAVVRARRPGAACADGPCPTVLPLRRRQVAGTGQASEQIP